MSKKQKRQYKRLDPEIIKEIVTCTIDSLREEEERIVKSRYDRKRANTKVLLRNYRSLVDHNTSAIYDAANMEEKDADLTEVLDLMSGSDKESFKVESIRQSVVRTRVIITHIDEMMELYRLSCERSPRAEDKRRYRIIYAMFVAEKTKTPDEISRDENIDRSTVYRDVDAAIERLTALIFGIDGLYFLKR